MKGLILSFIFCIYYSNDWLYKYEQAKQEVSILKQKQYFQSRTTFRCQSSRDLGNLIRRIEPNDKKFSILGYFHKPNKILNKQGTG